MAKELRSVTEICEGLASGCIRLTTSTLMELIAAFICEGGGGGGTGGPTTGTSCDNPTYGEVCNFAELVDLLSAYFSGEFLAELVAALEAMLEGIFGDLFADMNSNLELLAEKLCSAIDEEGCCPKIALFTLDDIDFSVANDVSIDGGPVLFTLAANSTSAQLAQQLNQTTHATAGTWVATSETAVATTAVASIKTLTLASATSVKNIVKNVTVFKAAARLEDGGIDQEKLIAAMAIAECTPAIKAKICGEVCVVFPDELTEECCIGSDDPNQQTRWCQSFSPTFPVGNGNDNTTITVSVGGATLDLPNPYTEADLLAALNQAAPDGNWSISNGFLCRFDGPGGIIVRTRTCSTGGDTLVCSLSAIAGVQSEIAGAEPVCREYLRTWSKFEKPTADNISQMASDIATLTDKMCTLVDIVSSLVDSEGCCSGSCYGMSFRISNQENVIEVRDLSGATVWSGPANTFGAYLQTLGFQEGIQAGTYTSTDCIKESDLFYLWEATPPNDNATPTAGDYIPDRELTFLQVSNVRGSVTSVQEGECKPSLTVGVCGLGKLNCCGDTVVEPPADCTWKVYTFFGKVATAPDGSTQVGVAGDGSLHPDGTTGSILNWNIYSICAKELPAPVDGFVWLEGQAGSFDSVNYQDTPTDIECDCDNGPGDPPTPTCELQIESDQGAGTWEYFVNNNELAGQAVQFPMTNNPTNDPDALRDLRTRVFADCDALDECYPDCTDLRMRICFDHWQWGTSDGHGGFRWTVTANGFGGAQAIAVSPNNTATPLPNGNSSSVGGGVLENSAPDDTGFVKRWVEYAVPKAAFCKSSTNDGVEVRTGGFEAFNSDDPPTWGEAFENVTITIEGCADNLRKGEPVDADPVLPRSKVGREGVIAAGEKE